MTGTILDLPARRYGKAHTDRRPWVGVTRFVAIWAGQLISVIGSALTAFGLTVYIYRRTGQVADLALVAAAAYVPQLLVAPIGGVIADRFDRRRVMLAADAGAALTTALLLVLAARDALGVGAAVGLVAIAATCSALQWPAWEAAIVELVPRDQLTRANGLVELSRGLAQLVAPIAGGVLVETIDLPGLVAIDLASFVIGLVTLVAVRFPPRRPIERRTWTAEIADAWRFVAARRGLVAMLVLFATTALTFGVAELLLRPLVLASREPWALGLVLSMVGAGIVIGAVAMAAWAGPRRKIVSILVLQLGEGSALIVAGAGGSLELLCIGAFLYGAVIPPMFACARYVWQVKVPLELQGRVTALRTTLVMLAVPIGYAVATPLAAVLGIREALIATGVVTMLAAIAAFAYAPYRRVELAP